MRRLKQDESGCCNLAGVRGVGPGSAFALQCRLNTATGLIDEVDRHISLAVAAADLVGGQLWHRDGNFRASFQKASVPNVPTQADYQTRSISGAGSGKPACQFSQSSVLMAGG